MSKKIGLHIGGRRFDVDLEEDFAKFLQNQMDSDFNVEGNNEIKDILLAYVRKNHELYLQEQKMQAIIKNIDE